MLPIVPDGFSKMFPEPIPQHRSEAVFSGFLTQHTTHVH